MFVANDAILHEVTTCQRIAHEWGERNDVKFDPDKETKTILGLHEEMLTFRLLGTTFDTRLRMEHEIGEICIRARWKTKSILRLKGFYPTHQLLQLLKTHVLPILEWNCATFYHATPTVLSQIDKIYERFLSEMSLSTRDAFVDFGLCHVAPRRDISMLGLLWKVATGNCHPMMWTLFPRAATVSTPQTRLQHQRHTLQLMERYFLQHNALCRRSIFGLVSTFNLLPPAVVHASNVSIFQKHLTKIVRNACLEGADGWKNVLSANSTVQPLARMETFLRWSQ